VNGLNLVKKRRNEEQISEVCNRVKYVPMQNEFSISLQQPPLTPLLIKEGKGVVYPDWLCSGTYRYRVNPINNAGNFSGKRWT
jgi:hypothetical protein